MTIRQLAWPRAIAETRVPPHGTRRDNLTFTEPAALKGWLCNPGYGYPAKLRPRAARLEFPETCQILQCPSRRRSLT